MQKAQWPECSSTALQLVFQTPFPLFTLTDYRSIYTATPNLQNSIPLWWVILFTNRWTNKQTAVKIVPLPKVAEATTNAEATTEWGTYCKYLLPCDLEPTTYYYWKQTVVPRYQWHRTLALCSEHSTPSLPRRSPLDQRLKTPSHPLPHSHCQSGSTGGTSTAAIHNNATVIVRSDLSRQQWLFVCFKYNFFRFSGVAKNRP